MVFELNLKIIKGDEEAVDQEFSKRFDATPYRHL
jgi:hypothetical protein